MPNDTSNRRSFLRSAGTIAGGTSIVGLAGCLGGDQATGEENTDTTTKDGGNSGAEYPTDDVQSIVPYATGGGFDAYSRIAAPYWEKYLETTVNVENVVGGGGLVGASKAYNADSDGHTIAIWDIFQAVTNQVGREVRYDVSEMSHIGALTQSPNAIVVMEEAGIEGWNDFADRVDELSFVTQGVGSGAHTMSILLGELTGEFSGDDLNFVHYGGTGEALSGLERGEGQVFTVATATSAAKVVQSIEGAEMFLVLSEPEEIDRYLKDQNATPVHYASDLDVENLDTYSKHTVFRRFFTGPPDVPAEILDRQRDAFQQIIDDDAFRDEALESGRPIINPGDHTQVEENISEAFDLFETKPYVDIFQEALDG